MRVLYPDRIVFHVKTKHKNKECTEESLCFKQMGEWLVVAVADNAAPLDLIEWLTGMIRNTLIIDVVPEKC